MRHLVLPLYHQLLLQHPKDMKRARDVPTIPLYESAPRLTQPNWITNIGVAGRLPLKTSTGLLKVPPPRPPQPLKNGIGAGAPTPQEEEEDEEEMVDVEEEDDNEEDDFVENEEAEVEENARDKDFNQAQPIPLLDVSVVTFSQLSSLPPKVIVGRREKRRLLIAELSQRILANPERGVLPPGRAAAGSAEGRKEQGVSSLMHLHRLCSDPDPTVRSLAIPSLAAVIADVAPSYRIRESAPEGELAAGAQLAKDTLALRRFEGALLEGYQRALRLFEFTVREGEAAAAGRRSGEQKGETSGGRAFEVDYTGGVGAEGANGSASAGLAAGDGESKGSAPERLGKKAWEAAKRSEKDAGRALRDGLVPFDGPDAPTLIALGRSALKALCFLLNRLPHFNFMANIVAFLVPRVSRGDECSRSLVAEGLKEAVKGDAVGQTGLEVARAVARITKDSVGESSGKKRVGRRWGGGAPLNSRLSLRTLAVLRSCPVAAILERADDSREDRSGEALMKKKKGKTMQEMAAQADILAGLRLADAEALASRKATASTTLRNIFLAYFRVLRGGPSHEHLLPEVLAGISQLSHLVDVGVVADVVSTLKGLIVCGGEGVGEATADATTDPTSTSLSTLFSCASAALKILGGPGRDLLGGEGDGSAIAKAVFRGLLGCVPASRGGQDHIPAVITVVTQLFLERSEYCMERVAAFAHRLAYLAVNVDLIANTTALISLVRSLCQRYASVGRSLLGGLEGGNTPYSSMLLYNAATAAATPAPKSSLPHQQKQQQQSSQKISLPLAASYDQDPDTGPWLSFPLLPFTCLSSPPSHFHPAVVTISQGMFSAASGGGSGAKAAGRRSWDTPAACLSLYSTSKCEFNPPPIPPQSTSGGAGRKVGAGVRMAVGNASVSHKWDDWEGASEKEDDWRSQRGVEDALESLFLKRRSRVKAAILRFNRLFPALRTRFNTAQGKLK